MENNPDDDVGVTLDAANQCFVIRIGGRTINVPPRQFEKLFQKVLAAAAEHIDAHLQAGERVEKNERVDAVRLTGMEAHTALGGQMLTRIHIGPLALNFASPLSVADDYCAQVYGLLDHERDLPQRPQ